MTYYLIQSVSNKDISSPKSQTVISIYSEISLTQITQAPWEMAEDTNFEEDQLASMTTDDVVRASRLLANDSRILKVSLSLSVLTILGLLLGST